MPSPTMPTIRPSAWRRATSAALSPGSTSASTRSTPVTRAIASAVRRLSPVSITTSSPRPRRAATLATASSLRVSATATTPAGAPSTATNIAVLPSAARPVAASVRSTVSMPASVRRRSLPTRPPPPHHCHRGPQWRGLRYSRPVGRNRRSGRGQVAIDLHSAVDHVHPARELVRPRTRRCELDCRHRERGEEPAETKIGKHDVRRAVTVLLPVEHDS